MGKVREIAKVSRFHPLVTMSLCTKLHEIHPIVAEIFLSGPTLSCREPKHCQHALSNPQVLSNRNHSSMKYYLEVLVLTLNYSPSRCECVKMLLK